MVVAADDGVMPQTREHAAVLAALGVTTGVVAVTKADLADPARALAEAAELLPGAEAVRRVGAHRRRAGRAARRARARRGRACPGARARGGALRLHVDRAFTIRGAGRWSPGRCGRGPRRAATQVTVLPAGRARARARRRGARRRRSSAPRRASASRSTSRGSRATRSRAAT